MCSLVTFIFPYVCESWTLTAELQRRIQAMEMRCYRKILHISCKDHVTNKDLLTIIKRCKLQRYGHASRSSGLAKTTVHARHSERGKKTRQTEEEVGRHQGMDRPGVRQVPEGSGEQKKTEKTGCKIIRSAPTTPTVKELMMMMMIFLQNVSSHFCFRFFFP